MNIIVLGPPGSGRNTQCNMLKTRSGWPHISPGQLLRIAIKNGTNLGKEATGYVNEGLLVPDQLVYALLNEYMASHDDKDGRIFDGFPRTIGQAKAFDNLLKDMNEKIDHVIYLEIEDDEVIRRISGRRICLYCGKNYHVAIRPPEIDNLCDVCKKGLETRKDDMPEIVGQRLKTYYNEAKAVIDFYKEADLSRTVDAKNTAEIVHRSICTAVGIAK